MSKPDNVNHPPHYKGLNGFETIDVIENFDLGFHLGNAVKYILRCGKKVEITGLVSTGLAAEVDDLAKARWYIDRVLKAKRANLAAWLALEAKFDRDHNRSTKRRARR